MGDKYDELHNSLVREGYGFIREIPGRGICGLFRFIYTTGIVIGMDRYSYEGRYCFDSFFDALKAFEEWTEFEKDPPGNWIKYKGRTEYINPNYEEHG